MTHAIEQKKQGVFNFNNEKFAAGFLTYCSVGIITICLGKNLNKYQGAALVGTIALNIFRPEVEERTKNPYRILDLAPFIILGAAFNNVRLGLAYGAAFKVCDFYHRCLAKDVASSPSHANTSYYHRLGYQGRLQDQKDAREAQLQQRANQQEYLISVERGDKQWVDIIDQGMTPASLQAFIKSKKEDFTETLEKARPLVEAEGWFSYSSKDKLDYNYVLIQGCIDHKNWEGLEQLLTVRKGYLSHKSSHALNLQWEDWYAFLPNVQPHDIAGKFREKNLDSQWLKQPRTQGSLFERIAKVHGLQRAAEIAQAIGVETTDWIQYYVESTNPDYNPEVFGASLSEEVMFTYYFALDKKGHETLRECSNHVTEATRFQFAMYCVEKEEADLLNPQMERLSQEQQLKVLKEWVKYHGKDQVEELIIELKDKEAVQAEIKTYYSMNEKEIADLPGISVTEKNHKMQAWLEYAIHCINTNNLESLSDALKNCQKAKKFDYLVQVYVEKFGVEQAREKLIHQLPESKRQEAIELLPLWEKMADAKRDGRKVMFSTILGRDFYLKGAEALQASINDDFLFSRKVSYALGLAELDPDSIDFAEKIVCSENSDDTKAANILDLMVICHLNEKTDKARELGEKVPVVKISNLQFLEERLEICKDSLPDQQRRYFYLQLVDHYRRKGELDTALGFLVHARPAYSC